MKRDDQRYDVVVIPGDGIGPELTEAAVGVLRAVADSGGHLTAASLPQKLDDLVERSRYTTHLVRLPRPVD